MAKSNKVLTIEITNESITVVEVTPAEKKQTIVHNALIFDTPEDSFDDGSIRDIERIASAIQGQLSANGITNKNVIFVLTSTKVVNREVLIPEMKEKDIKGTISSNASEYFPVNIEDYVVSHSVLEHVVDEDKQKKLKLMVVAAPLAMVKGYYELGSILGLTVQSIDYVGNAMLQMIKTQTSSNTTTMMIQMGSESTILNIVKGDSLLLQRTIPYGTSAAVAEVMDERGVDATTAMSLLQNERIIAVDFDDNAATGAFRYLINNIGRVIDYYVTKNPDKPIDDVFLSGDGALIRGIDGLFKVQLNIQTRVLDSLYNVKFDPKIDLRVYNPVYLVTAIGASFAPMGFRPVEVKSKSSAGGSSNSVVYAAVFAGFLILVGLGTCAISLVLKSTAQKKRDDLNAQIAAIQDVEQVLNEYKKAQAKYNDIAIMYDETRNLNENVIAFIDALEKNMPKDMVIDAFNADEDGVNITGSASSDESIAKLCRQLRDVECIDNAFVSAIEKQTNEQTGQVQYDFALRCDYVSVTENLSENLEEETDGSLQVQ